MKGDGNMNISLKSYRRSCLLGALGAILMLIGDLSLSIIPASQGDSGLFAREAYLNGAYETWRFPLLVGTGLIGIALCALAVRSVYEQILPEYRKTRVVIRVSGVVYLTSAMAIHLLIGSLADWTSQLSPLLGKEEALALVKAQYERVSPAMLPAYAGMVLLILTSAWAVATGKTFLPKKMVIVHMLIWQLVFILIPDIRQLCGTRVSTMDFVLSQGSGNAALFLYMIILYISAGRFWPGRSKALS